MRMMIMSSESELLINVWETFKDFVPASKRSEYAIDLMRHFAEYFDPSDLVAVVDEDDDLTEAYEAVCVDEDDDDEFDED